MRTLCWAETIPTAIWILEVETMILREIALALERVEEGQKEILERQELILKRLDAPESEGGRKSPDGWMQQGIDSILGYQAGKRKADGQ